MNPDKVCNFDCIYCQVDRRSEAETRFVEIDRLLAELDAMFRNAGAQPIFGPAPRPLAQLPLYIDSSGYLRAQDGYDEPIGPGFWERGGTT